MLRHTTILALFFMSGLVEFAVTKNSPARHLLRWVVGKVKVSTNPHADRRFIRDMTRDVNSFVYFSDITDRIARLLHGKLRYWRNNANKRSAMPDICVH